VPEEVTLQELIAQKDRRIRDLEADKQQMTQEIKLLKEKVDLLIRRMFGTRSEKLDEAQLELLLKEVESGKADASTEKVEASGDWKGLILAGYFTGGRLSDLARLKWSNVDLTEKTITFVQRKVEGKSPKARVKIPIHPALEEYLVSGAINDSLR
jgi:integrase